MRRKLRTFVTGSGVAIACAAMFSLVSFQRGYQSGLKGELEKLGAQVLVVPKGCPYDAASIALHGASWPCWLKESHPTHARNREGGATPGPLLMDARYDGAAGAQSVCVGAEPRLLAVKRGWRIDGIFPTQGRDCLIGANLAQ